MCSRRTWRIDQLLEAAQRLLHLGVQLAHGRVLDLVLAFDLLDDQLGVADQLQLLGPQRRRPLDPQQQRFVLGDVVGRPPDPLAPLLQHLAVGVLNDGRDRRRARVAAGAAVDVDDDLHRRLSQNGAADRLAAGRTKEELPALARLGVPLAGGAVELLDLLALGDLEDRPRRSSSRSTPHWYQQSSQATVIRTSPARPGRGADGDPRAAQAAGQARDGARPPRSR